jgi:hypothetical protein
MQNWLSGCSNPGALKDKGNNSDGIDQDSRVSNCKKKKQIIHPPRKLEMLVIKKITVTSVLMSNSIRSCLRNSLQSLKSTKTGMGW